MKASTDVDGVDALERPSQRLQKALMALADNEEAARLKAGVNQEIS
jgi:hypothetical protein